MTQLSNATLTTLESVYFDDYNEDKSFYRILFRPATAVQARELNQLQTILQKQVQRIGDHIFKEGSVVTGCGIIPNQFTEYVRTVDSFTTNLAGFNTIEDIDSTYLLTNGKNSNTAVRAKVYISKKGYQSNYPETNRIYLQYVFTGKDGSNNDVQSFANGDTLYVYNSSQNPLTTLSNTNIVASINVFTTNVTANAATGNAYICHTTDGVIFQKGFFQKVGKQYCIVNDFYPNANGVLVGFETKESIITENQDLTLNDNANGSTNYNAPGAHRLKLTPTLVTKTKTEANNTNFFALLEFDGNTVVIAAKDNIYSALGDAIAKRTSEESGDYVVTPFTVETTANTSDSNTFNYEISPGVSYVKGSRVEIIGTKRVTAYRANTTNIVQNKILTANYGNYVFCKEVLGAMNFDKLGEVLIYDSYQTSISDRDTLSGGLSGNIVGYANIRTVVWYSGTKGTSDCQYYVYLTNIRMNSGKSFANDAKSFYSAGSGGYTAFKADIIMDTTQNQAILYDATMAPLLYDTGYGALKSLTPTGGVNDTTFYYRKTTSSTLNTNGFVSFTLSGGLGAAGAEQIYDTHVSDYNIILSANAYSANLTGTITCNLTSNTVTGTGSKFQSELVVGSILRVSNSTGGTVTTLKVTAIASNTSLTISGANASAAATGNNYQLYYQSGHIFNISSSQLSVNAAANTFTVSNLPGYYANGLALSFDSGSGSTMYAQYPVAKSPSVQSAKTVSKRRLVKIDCSNNNANGTANSVGPWSLGLPDVLKINAIYVGTSGSAYSNTTADRSSWFKLDNGQRDEYYDLASISVLPSYSTNITNTSTILVDVDHLVTSTSSGIGYYTIDSYPICADGINSNSSTIALADVPIYNSKAKNIRYDLRNTIDFRAIKAATANSIANTNPSNTYITINPAAANANTWSISTYGQYTPEIDSQFIADYEYYLPRYDLVLLGPTGSVTTANGVPEVNPKKPLNISEASVVAESFVPAFPSLSMREAETAKRPDLATKITLKTNKRYTMRDIGVLEDRISKLEYYTVLSTLEKAAKDLAIPDSSGKDRFKNGIFADPFNNHALGNPGTAEYKISIDPSKSVARPDFTNHLIDFQYNSSNSSNIVKKGPYISLPYDLEQFAQQPYATSYRVCTESLWTWKGSAILSPSQDTFTDKTQLPAINNTLDLAKGVQDLVNSGFINTKIYGAQSSKSVVDTKVNIAVGGGGTTTTTDTTTTTTTTQDVTKLQISTTNKEYTLGNFVTDVSTVDYMRSIPVAFYSNSVKPNTKMHVFFDGINVDAYVAPGILNTKIENFDYTTKGASIVTTTGNNGSALYSNSSGCVAGVFTIPANTFRSGERKLIITDVDDLITGMNAILSKSEATFYSSGLAVSKQASTLTTINPVVATSQDRQTSVVVTKRHIVDFVPDSPPSTGGGDGAGGGGGGDDPIAQSFMVNVNGDGAGQFLTAIDLYFKQKDPTKGITLYLCEMSNGVPDFSKLLGRVHKESSEINVSEDAQTVTQFQFDHPIYTSSQSDYAFIVEPDGRSPEYLIWTAELGGFDIYNGTQVSQNPYDGVMFISSNRKTFTAMQKEDIKFKLYRARFTQTSGTLVLNNEDDDYLSLTGVVRANTRSIGVGDYVYSANATVANTTAGAPFGVVQSYDEATGKLVIEQTVAGFSNTVGSERIQIHRAANTSVTLSYSNTLNDTIIAYANVSSVDNNKYHTITPKLATMVPQGTNLNLAYKGRDTSYNADSNWNNIVNEDMNEIFDKERIVMSRSNEKAYASNNKSTFIQASFSTNDTLLSPIIDLRRKSSYFIENIINNDTTNENYINGNALSKYVSKTVVLADGQDAEDLKVYLTAFRPINSDIAVYAKIKSADDPESFDSKLWTLLSYNTDGNLVYSSQGKVNDFVEYQFDIPTATSTIETFNSNTAINATSDFISITNNVFVNNQIVTYYTATANTVVTNLSNNGIYYVVSANSSGLKLSASQGGANIDISIPALANSDSTGHYLRGYVPTVAHTAFLNPDSTPVANTIQYYNNNGSLMQGFKYFAIKIVLLSSDRVNYPRINDLRAIALQK